MHNMCALTYFMNVLTSQAIISFFFLLAEPLCVSYGDKSYCTIQHQCHHNVKKAFASASRTSRSSREKAIFMIAFTEAR